ncbi:DUF4331 family protein [Kribbella sp. CA-253562]|uniref:DUF4331 family protein n=1 Tax=Kribbella sp. CA-253562 TaxID=3239942 RepID=UPI003D8AD28F
MSHHLDSPLARQDVRLDITDLYAFRGETGTVLIINVCHSLAGDIPEPGYHPEGRYEFKLDLDGDSVEDLTYRFVFAERDETGRQALTVRRTDGADAGDPFAPGMVVAEGNTDEPIGTDSGLRVWAGKAGDPFWIEPDVLHAVGHAFQDGTTIDLGAWTADQAENLFAGHTVYSIVLEIPDTELLAPGQSTRPIGVWAVASLATDAGGWRSINRVGLPMIHPLFTQYNERLGDDLNGGRPSEDVATYGKLLSGEIAGVVRAYGTAEDPEAYAATVVGRMLPNVLPYVVGTPACFGFASWNGRSLTDNAPDVMFSIAANTPVSLGIGKESVTSTPRTSFPYVPEALR